MAAAALLSRESRSATGGDHAGLARIQRARLIGATLELAAERGVGGLSVAHIVERSGVSRRTFYEQFGDRQECVIAAFDDALADVQREVSRAYADAGEAGWRERIRAGLCALLELFAREPAVARFLVLEALACGEEVLARRGRVLARLAAAVDEGRAESRGGAALPPLTAEGVVGGALAILQRALLEQKQLPQLANPLMASIVLPYLGAAPAHRELARPQAPVTAGPRAHASADPFKAAGMRLTYRTVRVLLAVAELSEAGSGSSNRAVGTTAGISDPGQISKLLGRLQRIDLIVNSGIAPGQGAPNAWSLTQAGRELTDRIREHTTSFQ